MSGYPLFIPGFVLSTNPSLFKFKIANEHREFRNYLFILVEKCHILVYFSDSHVTRLIILQQLKEGTT